MTQTEFFKLTKETREAQKAFFKDRKDPRNLRKSIELEKKLDDAIKLIEEEESKKFPYNPIQLTML